MQLSTPHIFIFEYTQITARFGGLNKNKIDRFSSSLALNEFADSTHRVNRVHAVFKCGGLEAAGSHLRFSRKATVTLFDADRVRTDSEVNGVEIVLPDLPGGQSLSAQTVYAEHCGLIVLRDDGPYVLKEGTSWSRIGSDDLTDFAGNGL